MEVRGEDVGAIDVFRLGIGSCGLQGRSCSLGQYAANRLAPDCVRILTSFPNRSPENQRRADAGEDVAVRRLVGSRQLNEIAVSDPDR
jgi:hypothetical protein